MNISPIKIKPYQQLFSGASSCPVKTEYNNVSGVSKHSSYPNYSSAPASVLRRRIIEDRQNMLHPVKSGEEYEEVLKKIFKYTIQSYGFISNLILKTGYEKAPKELMGLISYCGAGDLSDLINCWLTSRSNLFSCMVDDEKMVNIINAFEYSLNKLDERFGMYEGTVYRVGFFNPITDKQFYSTSKSLGCTVKHALDSAPSPEFPYSIIKVKSGHDIHSFQQSIDSKVAKEFAQLEKEILIDRNSRFRKVHPKNYTPEDLKDILEIINKTMKFNLDLKGLENSSKSVDILKWVSVWEEI